MELIAAVVCNTSNIHEGLLRRHTQERLPRQMVPSQFLLFDRLPITVNGKLDRDAIVRKAKEAAHAKQLNTFGADSDLPLEVQLLSKWREILAVPAASLDDDFFELGGNSMATVELVVWASDALGVTLEPATLFEHETVRKLAAAIRSRQTPRA